MPVKQADWQIGLKETPDGWGKYCPGCRCVKLMTRFNRRWKPGRAHPDRCEKCRRVPQRRKTRASRRPTLTVLRAILRGLRARMRAAGVTWVQFIAAIRKQGCVCAACAGKLDPLCKFRTTPRVAVLCRFCSRKRKL